MVQLYNCTIVLHEDRTIKSVCTVFFRCIFKSINYYLIKIQTNIDQDLFWSELLSVVKSSNLNTIVTNSIFRIPISLQPDGVILSYFILDYLIYQKSYFEISIRSFTLGCKEIGIEKIRFVTKTQFLLTNTSTGNKKYKISM